MVVWLHFGFTLRTSQKQKKENAWRKEKSYLEGGISLCKKSRIKVGLQGEVLLIYFEIAT